MYFISVSFQTQVIDVWIPYYAAELLFAFLFPFYMHSFSNIDFLLATQTQYACRILNKASLRVSNKWNSMFRSCLERLEIDLKSDSFSQCVLTGCFILEYFALLMESNSDCTNFDKQ